MKLHGDSNKSRNMVISINMMILGVCCREDHNNLLWAVKGLLMVADLLIEDILIYDNLRFLLVRLAVLEEVIFLLCYLRRVLFYNRLRFYLRFILVFCCSLTCSKIRICIVTLVTLVTKVCLAVALSLIMVTDLVAIIVVKFLFLF